MLKSPAAVWDLSEGAPQCQTLNTPALALRFLNWNEGTLSTLWQTATEQKYPKVSGDTWFWQCSLFSCLIASTCSKSAGLSLSAETQTFWNKFSSPLSAGAHGLFYKLDCKLTCGSFQRGNGISRRNVCFSQIKYSSPYHVFWAGCHQRINGAENEIRSSVMESWNNWKMAQKRRNQPVWHHLRVLLYGNLAAQQLSTQHNEGHKHTLYIHGFPCTTR